MGGKMNQLPVSVGPPMPPSKAPCVLALAVLPVTVVYAASPIDLVSEAIAGIVGYVDDMILGVVGLGVDLALRGRRAGQAQLQAQDDGIQKPLARIDATERRPDEAVRTLHRNRNTQWHVLRAVWEHGLHKHRVRPGAKVTRSLRARCLAGG